MKKYKIIATCFDKRGRILSKAFNSYSKTHPEQARYAKQAGVHQKVFLHAEVSAILRARDEIHEIYIERYDVDGNSKLAKPCPVCQQAIKEARIKNVRYTTGY